MLSGWLRWWLGSSSSTDPEVVLYTRSGCHLCDEAHAFLQSEQKRFSFRLAIHDVDASPETQRRFGECVPVVLVDGQVRFRGRIQPVLWRRLMRSRNRGSPGA